MTQVGVGRLVRAGRDALLVIAGGTHRLLVPTRAPSRSQSLTCPGHAASLQACAAARRGLRRPSQPLLQEERDAAARLRAWQKLELDALELYAHMLRQCASGARPPAGKGRARAKGKRRGKKHVGEAESEEGSPPPPAKRRRQEAAGPASAAAAAAAVHPQDDTGSAEAGGRAARAAAGSGSEKPSKEVLQAQVIGH